MKEASGLERTLAGHLLRATSVASLLAIWVLFAQVLAPAVVPGPGETTRFIVGELRSGALLHHVGATVQRVVLAFAVGMLLGVGVGAWVGSRTWVDRVLEGWVVAGLTIPRIMLFVVAYLLLGLTELAIVVALVLTIVPSIVVQIREGMRALDPGLASMARVYRRPRLATWRRIVLPQLLPYVAGTARSSLSMSWRLVMLGELLGRTSGVGYQIYFYFQMFDMRGILAYGLTMMVLLAILDLGVMGALHRRAFAWRSAG